MLEQLEPKRVFGFFEALCAIPHGSENTRSISDFCVAFAKERGIPCRQDALGNVILKKPATPGYETHPPVILQGHLDMVCEKCPELAFDFTRDPIRPVAEGDFVHACGTTLGGDDGIAVAMILALFDDDALPHPPLEALFTVNEETGMDGALGVDLSVLEGRRLINIDSEAEGVFTVSCAGGAKIEAVLPLSREENRLPCREIVLSGLLGGHSGADIHLGRSNAILLLARLLRALPASCRLVSIDGGARDNVIPSTCRAVVAGEGDWTEAVNAFLAEARTPGDPGLTVTVKPTAQAELALNATSSARVLSYLNALPFGVLAMSKQLPGLVETSVNPGVVTTAADLTLLSSVRSSVSAEKEAVIARLRDLNGRFGASTAVYGDYPAWEYREASPLRESMVAVYRRLFDSDPRIEAIHAGLECGLFSERLPGLDAVSIGPDILDIHSVNERLSVSSTARTYRFLRTLLQEL